MKKRLILFTSILFQIIGIGILSWNSFVHAQVVVEDTEISDKKETTFLPWIEFNAKIKRLAAGKDVWTGEDKIITGIERSLTAPNAWVSTIILSKDGVSYDIVWWFNSWVVYYYTEADNIYLNEDSSYMFYYLSILDNIELNIFDTSRVTNMSYMFYNCWVTSINVANWNTSKVTNMAGMFKYCRNLRHINWLEKWNTSKVTNMSSMFVLAYSLTKLDLSNWNVSKVTDMSQMFSSCYDLSEIKGLKNWNVSSVTNMSLMFNRVDLNFVGENNIENWNVSNVTDMSYMFQYCSYLYNLDFLSNWDVSHVTNMQGMFIDCSNLRNVDWLKDWNTSNVTNMAWMFIDCYNLWNIDWLKNWDVSHVTNMQSMFRSCQRLSSLDQLKDWDTSNVTNMIWMFERCNNLVDVDWLKNWDTSNVTTMKEMFINASSIITLDISNWNTSKLKDAAGMFENCKNLETIYASSDFNVTNSSMFSWDEMLIWWNGTEYFKVKEKSSSYAKIDRPWTPWYFTLGGSYTITEKYNVWFFNGNKVFRNIVVESGEIVENPWQPTREDATFLWWYITWTQELFDFNTLITWNINLYAKWDCGEGFMDNGSSCLESVKITFNTNWWNSIDSMNVKKWLFVKQRWSLWKHVYSHTSNIDDDGGQNWSYPQSTGYNDVVTITWATSLHVSVIYQTYQVFSSPWDYLCVWQWKYPNYSTTAWKCSNSKSGVLWWSKNAKVFDIDWDSVTFTFYSSYPSSSKGYWYYAVITANMLELPEPQRTWFAFKWWYKDPLFEEVWDYEVAENDITLYAKWETVKYTQFDRWYNVNSKLMELMPEYKEFRVIRLNKKTEWKTYKVLSTSDSEYPIWAWYENWDIYYYSEADVLYLNPDSSRMFSSYISKKVSYVDFRWWDTSNVTNMDSMFLGSLIENVDWLKNWDTSKVTNMIHMFSNTPIKNVDWLRDWDISNVTRVDYMFSKSSIENVDWLKNWVIKDDSNIHSMFQDCSELKNVDWLRDWDVSNVKYMQSMFKGCSKLWNVDWLKNWNTSKVTDMSYMFNWCSRLSDVNWLKNWDTSNVTSMSYMFNWCSRLSNADWLRDWNVSKVAYMESMFKSAWILNADFLVNWNTSSLTNVDYMFSDINIWNLDLSRWNKTNIIDRDNMFNNSNIWTLDISNWNLKPLEHYSNSYDYYYNNDGVMFYRSYIDKLIVKNWNLENIDNMNNFFNYASINYIDWISDWDVSNIEIMDYFFYGSSISNLESISGWDVSNATQMNWMFYYVRNKSNFDFLSGWNVQNVTGMHSMFNYSSINNLDFLENWNISNVQDMSYMFSDCDHLINVDLSFWDVSHVTNMQWMFQGSTNLEELNLKNWDTSNVTNMDSMFLSCSSLKTIFVSDSFSTKKLGASWGGNMFYGDTQLVGWNWTKYDEEYRHDWYARVDYPWQKWYFTDDEHVYAVFFSNWKKYVANAYHTWDLIIKPSDPRQDHSIFSWWYDELLETPFNFNSPIENHVSIFAKWDCEEWYIKEWNKCQKVWGSEWEIAWFNEFTVYKPSELSDSDWPESYTIMDRNLWATSAWLECTKPSLDEICWEEVSCEQNNSSSDYWYGYWYGYWYWYWYWGGSSSDYDDCDDSEYQQCLANYNNLYDSEDYCNEYWYYYQWWNNYVFIWIESSSSERVNTTTYSRNNPFKKNIFVNNSSYSDWSLERNDDLWWDTTDTYIARQGPCLEGWHVPTKEEWEWFINYWKFEKWYCSCESFGAWYGYWYGYGYGNGWSYSCSCEDIQWFWYGGDTLLDSDLWLIWAWYRSSLSYLNGQWESYFWTSSPSWNNVYRVRISWTEVSTDNTSSRKYALPIRCFKNPESGVKVIFETNWWGSIPYQFIKKWSSVTKPDDPVKNWYKFDWWYTDNGSFNNKYNFSSSVQSSFILYAKWIKLNKVSFNSNWWSSVQEQSVVEWNVITKPNNPERIWYVFDWWYTDDWAFENRYDFETPVEASFTLYAKWLRINKVSFDTNGWSAMNELYVDFWKKILWEEIAWKRISHTANIDDDWNRNWWYWNDQDFNDVVSIEWADQLKVELTYQTEGGYDGLCIKKWNYSYYEFEGCEDSDSGLLWDDSKQTREFIIEWDSVTFVFWSDGNNDNFYWYYAEITWYKNLKNPTKVWYSFEWWYKDSGLSQIRDFETDTVNSDITLYAKWNKVPEYTFKAGEWTFSDWSTENTITYEKKQAKKIGYYTCDQEYQFRVPYAEKINLQFSEINSSSLKIIDNKWTIKEIEPEYDYYWYQIYQWVDVQWDYVKIIDEDSSCYTVSLSWIGYYKDKEIEKPTRQWYTFEWWYKEWENGEQIDFDIEKDFVAEDITLHAKWLKNIVYTYNANWWKFSDNTNEKNFEYPYWKVTKVREWFWYWNWKDDVYMQIVWANWIVVDVSNDDCSDEIQVFNNSNIESVRSYGYGYGYGFDGDSIFVKKNWCDTAKVTLKWVWYNIWNEEVETPTKDGYEFVWWNTDPEAQDKLDVLPNEALDTTFYAIFTKKIEVTFDINGNNWSTQKVSCNLYNDDEYCPITAPEIPEPEGWEVIGYDTDKDWHENNWSVWEQKVVSEDMTYYAQVKRLPIQKYVTFDVNGNTSFKYGENPVVTTSWQYELCQTPVTYNWVVDNTCSAEIVFPTIQASWTKEVLWWSRSPENLSDIINVDTLMRLTLKWETTNVTYYAQTKKDKVTYSVIFNWNGALLRNNTESELQTQWTASCETEDSYNSEDETKSTECEIQLPEIIREGYIILWYSTGIDDLEASIKRAQEKLILTPENNWTIYYAISYKPLYTVFKTNWNLQIQSKTTVTTENDVTEPCSLRNTATTCTIKTPVIVGAKQWEVWYSSSDEKSNRFDNRQNEDTEIIVSEDTPKTYYAWSVSNPATFTVSYLTGKWIESIWEIPAGADQCTPELTYNDEELKTTCTITNLPNVIQKVGYNTPLWYDQNDDSEGFTPNSSYNTEISWDITFVANATANTDTQYIVKHYFQMLEDNKITNKYELKYTDTKVGETDTNLILSNLQVDEDKSVGFKYRLGKVNGQFTSNEIPEDELEGLLEQNLDAYDGAKVLEIHLFYQRKKYAFALENNDSSKIDVTWSSSNNNYYYEQELDLSWSVTNDCYVRSGWDGIDTWLEIIETSENKNIAKLKMPSRALTVSPEVKEKTYNVSFNKNAENVEWEMETLVAVKCSEWLTLPENQFKKNGYSFLWWSRAAESEKEFDDNETLDTPLTKDNRKHETLYAQWHLDAYEIKYVLNDGIVLEPNPSIYTYENGDILINNPIKTGYTFLGWSGTDVNGSSFEVIIPSGSTWDRNYEANWEINHYSIYFNTEWGSEVETITQEYATPVTAPSDPTKEGYTFLGWNKEIPSTMPAEDTTITANWHINTYNFTLTGNGGIIDGDSEIYSRWIVYNDEVEVPEVERLWYTFLGWDIELPERMPAEDTWAIAQWQANKYTVKFVNWDEEKIQEFEYDEEKALDENTFEKEGYTFAGWISWARTYNDKQVVKNLTANSWEVIELTAEWNPVPYTVTFYKNDGTNEKTVEHFVYDKQRAIQTSYERDGYFFKGWNTESDGNWETKESPVLNWTNEGWTNIDLYAQWELVPYTIVYTLDGWAPVEENPNNYGYESEFALKDPSRVGYHFLWWTGWVLDETYRNELNWTSEPSKEIVITYGSTWDRAYTAKWQARDDISYTVKHVLQALDGSYDDENGYPDYLEWTADSTVVPVVNKYSWFSDATTWEYTINPDGSTVIFYHYPRNSYKLTFKRDNGSDDTSATLKYGETIVYPENPTKVWYTFFSWSENDDTMPAKDFEIWALYDINQYTLTLNTNGWSEIAPITQDFDTEITVPETTKIWYTFAGWEPKIPARMPAENISSSAQWNANPYKVIFHANNLTSTDIENWVEELLDVQDFVYDEPQKLQSNSFEKAGYHFLWWSNSSLSTEVIYANEQQVNNLTSQSDWTIDLYAVWEPDDDTVYKVKYLLQNIENDEFTALDNEEETLGWVTDTPTKAEAKTFEWFTLEPFEQKNINGDGSTVVEIKYTRNEYTITFNSNKGSAINPMTLRYNSWVIAPENPNRLGYTFNWWTPSLPSNMPANNFEVTAEWLANTWTHFTVEYYVEYTTWGYSETPTQTVVKTGTTDTSTNFTAPEMEWFVVQPYENKNIEPDESTVLKIYYKRLIHTVTYDSRWGSEVATKEVRFWEKIERPAITKVGYRFDGWSWKEFMPNEDVTLTAEWTARSDIKYTVKHLQENANDEWYTENEADREELIWTTDTPTQAVSKDYPWFVAQQFSQENIKWDNTTVVEIKYNRLSYDITFNSNKWTKVNKITAKYDENLTAPEDPTRKWYTFDGWNPQFPSTMPLNWAELTAQWSANTWTAYVVHHYLANLDWSFPAKRDYEDESQGETDTLTKAAPKVVAGYTAQAFEQENIEWDWSTIVNIYYDRNIYTVSYDADWWTTPTEERMIFGDVIPNKETTRPWYDFVEWTWATTVPAGDVTVKAIWNERDDTLYTVKHYLQKVSLDGYAEVAADRDELHGRTNSDTQAEAKTYDWFTAKTFSQKAIEWEGTTVVQIFYDRNEYTLSFDSNWGTPVASITAKYGTALTYPTNPIRTWYAFTSWSPKFPSEMPLNGWLLTAQWSANNNTQYSIEYYYQKLDGTYPEEPSLRKTASGTTDTQTDKVAETISGYTVQDFDQVNIDPEGDAVLKLYYNRNAYTLNYYSEVLWVKQEGEQVEKELKRSVTLKYQEPIDTTPLAKSGYRFEWWKNLPANWLMPYNDLDLEAQWSVNQNTEYKVYHRLQNVYDDNYSIEEVTEKTWTTDTLTNAETIPFVWFTAKAFDQQYINGDNSTIVEIRYDRNSYTIDFDGNQWTTPNAITERFGTDLTVPAIPVRTWYTFAGWSPSFPSVMPAENRTLTAWWTANTTTKYTVSHYLQNVEDDAYTEDIPNRENKIGTTDTLTDASARTYDGFTAQKIKQENISWDDSTNVKIYYKRNYYTISFDANSWSETDPITDKYGATIIAPNDPTRLGYTFKWWNPSLPSTMPVGDSTVVAQWKANTDTKYTIEYYLQGIDWKYPQVASLTRIATWETDTETNVVAEDILGFKVHTIQQTNINSDESGIARVYYTREQYQVSYDTNWWTAIQERMVKFEDDIPTPETTREGYTFNSWANMPSNGKMPAESIELLAQWTPNTDTKYTVKHLWEKVDESGYEVHATEEKIGTTEELTEASAIDYDWFTAQEFEQQVINWDGSTVVEIKYDRNTYDITFDTNWGLAKSPVSAKYEETLDTTEDPEKEWYTFEEWEPTYPKSMPLRGARLMAKWTPNTDTEYTIEYYLQDIDNADDEYPDEPSYSTTATWTTDTIADVVVPEIEWFTAQDVDPVIISPDGSSVVKIYYKRNSHLVTYDVDWGTAIPSETIKYEDDIPTPVTTKTWYTFLEWLNMPSDWMMPDSDVELLASWRANNNTKYTVVHLQENANNSNYSEVARETLTWTTDTLTKAVAKSYPWFNAESFVQEYINWNELTVVEIKYKRNQYTISFDANSWSATEPITDKYWATLTAPKNPTRQWYTFAGWNPGFPSTMPLDGKTLRAQWIANDNTQYTIEYYLQELNGEYPTNPSSTRSAIWTTDEETNVVAETIEWFKAQPISNVKIAWDGSSVVKVYYTRNSYTLSYNTNGWSSIHDVTLLYEEVIPLPETTRAWYTFSSWKYLPSNEKMPASNLEIIAQWTANNNTKYTVRHLLENTYDDEYSEDEDARETKSWTTDAQTKASAKSYPWFTALPVSQTTISWDESTIVDVKYTRNVYVVDFNTRGWTTIDAITWKYQVALTEPSAPTKTWYVFNWWNFDFPETMPLDGKTLVAKWKASTGTQYTVYHYLADLNWTFGQEPADVDYLKWETEQLTQAKTKVYAGFEPRDITQETILADGSTIVNVYYDRKEYIVTYDPDWGTPVESVSLKFESPIPNKTTSKPWYDFVEWAWATTVPADDVTVTAIWSTRDDTVYTVKHFLENANDSEYAERVADETTETGRTEWMTNAKAKNYKWFTAQTIEQKTIEWDGSTVVEVYYTRNSYTINFNSDGWTAVSPITSKYGATVTAPENPTKTWYEFNWWSPNMPTTMPENGATLTAQWNASTTTYTVEHKVQSLEDVNIYTLRESEVVEWITESMTNAKAKDYSWFAADEISQVVINWDHSTIVPVYYTRQSYKLNYNVAGWEEIASVTLKYQENIPLPTPSKQGYEFVEWTNIPENNKMPANDVTLVAKWSPRTDTSYTVKHLTENLNDGWYTEVLSDRIVKFGTTEELTNATANTYAGFTVQPIEQKEISGDSSTVVEVKYSRNSYTISFDSNGWTAVPSITEKYQTALTSPENPTRKGYSFWWWEPKFPQVMWSEDTTLVAKWNAWESSYIVNHYVKNLAWNWYTLKEQETLAWKTESQTQAKEKSYEWFSLEKEIVQKEIKSDDSTIVDIYYKRNVYHITWIAWTGVEAINESWDYAYWTTVKVQARTKVGYTFSWWVSEKEFAAVVPARNSNIIVSATPNTYTIRYHANGWEGKMDDQIFTYDMTWTLNENTYVNSWKVLVGWSSEKWALYPAWSKVINLTTKWVFDLYAEWQASYKVIYKDANAVLFEEEYASGDVIKPSRTPSKNGYRFDWWDGMPKDNLMWEEDIEVTAKWINDQPAKSSSGWGWGARVVTKDTSSVSTPVLVSEDSDTSVKKEEKTSTVEEPVIQEEDDHTSAKDTWETVKNVESHPTVTEEVLTAYQWSYKNEVTTLAPVERAMPEGYVYRWHMAKMVVNYALNVLWWELPEETPEECSRSDDASDWESNEIKNYARMSCELGIMWIEMDNFEPTRYVTRAQFGTILSRLLWWDTYNQEQSQTTKYYERHLNTLKEKWIITQIENPEERIELREWVWVMLRRSDEYIKSSNTYKLWRSNTKTSNVDWKVENKEETWTMSTIFDSLFKKVSSDSEK